MSGGMTTTDVSGKAEIVLTTKGDIATWDTARVRKGVSATNYTGLQADSAIADGLTYGATARSTLDVTGKMLYASAANTLAAITAGAEDTVLTMGASSVPAWAVAGGGATVTRVQTNIESTFTTTSSGYVDVTNFTATLPNISGGFCTIAASAECRITVATASYKFSINTGEIVAERNPQVGSLNERFPTVCYYVNDADGAAMKMEAATNSGTLSIYGETDNVVAQIQILGVG